MASAKENHLATVSFVFASVFSFHGQAKMIPQLHTSYIYKELKVKAVLLVNDFCQRQKQKK